MRSLDGQDSFEEVNIDHCYPNYNITLECRTNLTEDEDVPRIFNAFGSNINFNCRIIGGSSRYDLQVCEPSLMRLVIVKASLDDDGEWRCRKRQGDEPLTTIVNYGMLNCYLHYY